MVAFMNTSIETIASCCEDVSYFFGEKSFNLDLVSHMEKNFT